MPHRGLVDHERRKRGLRSQRRAREFFDVGDWEEALYAYRAAEDDYRLAFPAPGPRVFFMQSTALRCLEELLEGGRRDLLSTYQSEAERFFRDWDSDQLHGFATAAVEDANAFLLWRKSYAYGKVAPVFAAATEAIQHGDFQAARSVLEDLITRLEGETFPGSQALRTIARSKQEMLVVQEELRKREDQRDLRIVIEGYRRAADVSQLPEGSDRWQEGRINAFREWFLSWSCKYEAFAALITGDEQNPASGLQHAEESFERGMRHAEKAGNEFPVASHLLYLSFWRWLCRERRFLIAYLNTGSDADFEEAQRSWLNSVQEAQAFADRHGTDSLFPNRYYSMEDLQLENLFLSAALAFRRRRWREAADLLGEWRKRFPQEYRWSWRETQIRVRELLSRTLDAFELSTREELQASCTHLARLRSSETIGNAARLMVAEAVALQWKQPPLSDETVGLLCRCFPLDAHMPRLEGDAGIDIFLSLPNRIYSWFEQARHPTSASEMVECVAKLQGALEAALGYIVDYQLQVRRPGEPLPKASVEVLMQQLHEMVEAYWGERLAVRRGEENLAAALAELDSTNSRGYEETYAAIRGALGELLRLMPVIVEVFASERPSAGRLGVRPDWMLHLRLVERDRILLLFEPGPCPQPGQYFLPPEWRKGDRLSYPVGKLPLLPVRFQPRWEAWQREATNSALLFLEGVTLQHLEQAITLAEGCAPEDGRPRPKVGAVIVRSGKVIATAHRNEDGKGIHAEWAAIQAAQDPKKLKGAVLVTTLEPCTTRPHTQNLACAELVVHFGFQRVVIGILDPNPSIRGLGDQLFRMNNIDVAYFPSSLSKRIWELNSSFVASHTNEQYREVRLFRR